MSAARFAAWCGRTSTGVRAPTPARRPAACASRAGCGSCGLSASRCRLVQQVLEIVGTEAAGEPLAVGEEKRRRAVHAELAADLQHLVDRVGAARARL